MKALKRELLKVCKKYQVSYNQLQNVMKEVRQELQKEEFYEKPKRSQKLPLLPSMDQIRVFISKINDYKNITYKLWFFLVFTSGIRVKELINIQISDINLSEKKIFIRNGKGSKDRYVLILPEVAELLDSYIRFSKGNIFIFENNKKRYSTRRVQQVFKSCKEKAGIKADVNPHGWRHYILTALTEAGWNEASIMKQSGHSDKNSLAIYQHLNVDNMRTEYDQVVGSIFRSAISG